MVLQSGEFWWQDSSCLTTTVQSKTTAPICQHERIAPTTSPTLPPTTTAPTTTTTTTTTPTTTTTTPLCDQGWDEFQGHCYLFSGSEFPTYWLSAEFSCGLDGAHLASIHSKDELDFVLSISPMSAWLGGSDIVAEVQKIYYVNIIRNVASILHCSCAHM